MVLQNQLSGPFTHCVYTALIWVAWPRRAEDCPPYRGRGVPERRSAPVLGRSNVETALALEIPDRV